MSSKGIYNTLIWTQLHSAISEDFDIQLPMYAGEQCTQLINEITEGIINKDLNDLLNQKLPVDVKIGNGTNKAGTTIRTLALRIKAINELKHNQINTKNVETVGQLMEVL